MPFKTWFNPQLVLQAFKSAGWVSILSTLGFLFLLPFHLLMNESNKQYAQDFNSLFDTNWLQQSAIILAAPVLLTVFLFKYMHKRSSSDYIHSLPITRKQLYISNTLYALVGIVVPLIITTLVMLIVEWCGGWDHYHFSYHDLWHWSVIVFLFQLIMFSLTQLVGMITSSILVHVILTYIFAILPTGLVGIIHQSRYIFEKGFTTHNSDTIVKLSPIFRLLNFDDTILLQQSERIMYIVLSIIFVVASYFLYKVRPLEKTGQAIIFQRIVPILKLGITGCSAMLAGLIIGHTFYTTTSLIIGYAVGAIAGYYICMMVLKKTWRVFGYFKGLVCYAALTALCIGAIVLYSHEAESHVPNINNISAVKYSDDSLLNASGEYTGVVLTDRQSISKVIKLQKYYVKHAYGNFGHITDSEQVVRTYSTNITYILKNGKSINKVYFWSPTKQKENLEKNFITSKQFIQKDVVFNESSNNIGSLEFSTPLNKTVNVYDKKVIRNILAALKQDKLHRSYDEMHNKGNGTNATMYYTGSSRTNNFNILQTDKNTVEVLKNHHLYNKVMLNNKLISAIYIGSVNNLDHHDEELTGKNLKKHYLLKVADSKQIENLIPHLSSFDFYIGPRLGDTYLAYIVYKDKKIKDNTIYSVSSKDLNLKQ